MMSNKELLKDLKKESRKRYIISSSFSAYCLLRPNIVMNCFNLRLNYWETQSVLYSSYVEEKDECRKYIRSIQRAFKKLLIKIMEDVKKKRKNE